MTIDKRLNRVNADCRIGAAPRYDNQSSGDARKFAEMLKIPLDERGFFVEEHQLLAPVASAVEGIFVIGCARGPQSISESIVQAEAAAGKILSALVPGRKL